MKPLIAFVAPPFAGHLNAQVTLAEAAATAGYRVSLITGAAKIGMLRQRGLDAPSLRSLAARELEEISDTRAQVGSNPLLMWKQLRQAAALMSPVRDELIELWRDTRPDLVVADFITVPAGIAAQTLGIPWVTTVPSPFAIETRSGPPSYLGGLKPLPSSPVIEGLRNWLGWSLIGLVKDTLFKLMARERKSLGLTRRKNPDGSEAIYSSTGIFAPTMAELEFSTRPPPQFRFIGPMIDNPEQQPEFDLPTTTGPCVLVTLGTHLPWAKQDLVGDVERLARRLPHVSFVVSLGDTGQLGPEPVLADTNVTVFGFVPYATALKRVDAVIHHGGAGITFGCILAGRPALVCPQDYDQFDYAARIEHFGAGERIERIDADDTATKLAKLLKTPPAGLSALTAAAHAYRPAETFLAHVDSIIATGRLAD